MLIVFTLNLFSSVMAAFGQCIKLEAVTLQSEVTVEKLPASDLFLVLCLAWKTSPHSCELKPPELRCKDSFVPSDRAQRNKHWLQLLTIVPSVA